MEISKDIKLRVIGVGKVGMSITQAFAQAGFSVCGTDVDQSNIDNGMKKVEKNLDTLVSKGKMTEGDRDGVLSRMEFSTDFEIVKDADVIIEAIFEDMNLKKETFKKLDATVASHDALLLTNTSGLSLSEIAAATQRPEQVAGMHFFNPVPIMRLVEVVRGALTADKTVDQVKELSVLMGKTPIVSADSPGFIVNRMLNALAVEGAKIVQEGVGSIEDVDTGVKLGLGHPMGPFELMDYLDGIPLIIHVTDYQAQELGERFRMPVWVKNIARAGLTGRSTGRGYYDYSKEEK
ncbi:MAG: 3-hydroxyacyl-CoA dehydrogenase family protein [Deltaproteobacteria bacterium]|nr:3-hydroxyacyl-CoA dehydrogenase family protein [Deltaproteobacteria bacterium]